MKEERILEAAREKERVSYKGVPITLSADFSKETLQARRGWKEVFQVMKGNGLLPRLLYPAKETNFQEVQEAQSLPKKLDLRNHTPRHIIITFPKLETEGENLTSSKRKGHSYLQRSSDKTVS